MFWFISGKEKTSKWVQSRKHGKWGERGRTVRLFQASLFFKTSIVRQRESDTQSARREIMENLEMKDGKEVAADAKVAPIKIYALRQALN